MAYSPNPRSFEIQDLLDLLADERRGCQELLDLVLLERSIIASGSVEELAAVANQKEAIADELSILEGRRSQLTQTWAQAMGDKPFDGNIEDLRGLLGQAEYAQLLQTWESLVKIAAKLAESNKTNTILLQDLVNVHQEILQNTMGLAYGGNAYSASGLINQPSSVVSSVVNYQA